MEIGFYLHVEYTRFVHGLVDLSWFSMSHAMSVGVLLLLAISSGLLLVIRHRLIFSDLWVIKFGN